MEVADNDSTLQRKIRAAHKDRVPYQIIVGDDEQREGAISVRDRKERTVGDIDPEAFLNHLRNERDEQRIEPDFLE